MLRDRTMNGRERELESERMERLSGSWQNETQFEILSEIFPIYSHNAIVIIFTRGNETVCDVVVSFGCNADGTVVVSVAFS